MSANELAAHQGAEVARDRYDDRVMVETLKQTVAKGATDAQFRMFIEVCRATGLNPFLREVWFVPSVGIMAGRDGYLAIANKHPQFDGMSTHVDRDDKMVPIKATCTVWRKDRGHPIICEAYYSEYKKGGNVWSQYPSAMISKVAEVLALKRSFAINGVVTEEEIGSGEPLPRGSAAAAAAAAVAEAKINGEMPLAEPEAPAPPEPASTLDGILSTFGRKDQITAAFGALKAEWLKYESEEAWNQTMEQFQIVGDQYRSIGNAKRCFTALWNATEKIMLEAQQEQPHAE
jgi:phage recombination protein Bet